MSSKKGCRGHRERKWGGGKWTGERTKVKKERGIKREVKDTRCFLWWGWWRWRWAAQKNNILCFHFRRKICSSCFLWERSIGHYPTCHSKGPFIQDMTASFSTFQCNIAKITPCNVNSLNVESFTWKYNKPANAVKMLINTKLNYSAMITSAELKKTPVIFVYMWHPSKDVVSVCVF